MNFVITHKNAFQQQKLAKTTARRKKNTAKVGLSSLTAHASVNDLMPDIMITKRNPNELKGPRRRVRKTEDRHLAETVARSLTSVSSVRSLYVATGWWMATRAF